MTASQIITNVRALGGTITAADGRLRIDAPAGAITDDLRNQVRAHKPEIMAMLTTPEPTFTLPDRPADKSGHVAELIRRDGEFQWRHRPVDAADLAMADHLDRTRGMSFAEIVQSQNPRLETATVEGVPTGWTAPSWVARLRQMADSCEAIRPDLADQHRDAADAIEGVGA